MDYRPHMKHLSRCVRPALLCALSVLAAACSDGGSVELAPLTVSGSITGLSPGASIVLENPGSQPLSVSANGSFIFAFFSTVPRGASYDVTISQQPAGEKCIVTNGSGIVGTTSVGSVLVNCIADDHTVSGTVAGLLSGRSLVLQDNGGDSMSMSANGSFSFPTAVANGTNYAVTVLTQPMGQSCAVTNGSGTIGTSDVADVEVHCSDNTYNVAVRVSGVNASGLRLQDNGTSTLSVSSNGTFDFNTPIASGSAYSVTLASDPVGESCAVSNGSGTVESSNVTNLTVICVPGLYQISGTLSGMLSGGSIVLQDNGGNSTTISANGSFFFSTPIASGSGYAVTVFSQPVGQTCSVALGSGTVMGANVENVGVNCSDNSYNIAVSVSGILRSGLTLLDNGGDNLSILTNGTHNFNTPIASGSAYAVTILSQPAGESCSVTNGTGTVVGSNVTGIMVTCTPNNYSIGGSVSGLLSGNSVVLEDNGGNSTTVSGNGSFVFSTPIASGAGYAVTATSPPGQSCSVTAGSGTVISANVNTVVINCSDNTYNVAATVTGVNASGLVLLDNGGDSLTVSANQTYNFATPLASGSAYDVTTSSLPTGESCTVTNGSGTVTSSNVTATVNCTPNDYSIGGSVTGLLSGNSIILQDNGANSTTVSSNTSFTFSTKIASGSSYAVSISTYPVGQSCTVTKGSGTVAGANFNQVLVNCSDNDYNIGVTVSGLNGSGLELQDNGADTLDVASDGTYTFGTPVAAGSTYAVTVLTQPSSPGQICTVSGGSGKVAGSNVTVSVSCENTYTIGGTLSGLTTGSIVLQDNHTDNLTLLANGSFTFATPIADGSPYDVTVLTQPSGQDCTVSGGSGTVGAGNVTTVSIICSGAWTWMSGSNTQGAAGFYGTPLTSDVPGARYSSATWTDSAGNLWLFGGVGYDSHGNNVYFNDLWEYSAASGSWTWVSGSSTTNVSGVYGMLGTPLAGDTPGARSAPVSWRDSSGNLWLFGGYGYDSAGNRGNLNDLWEFSPTALTWTWMGGSNIENAFGVYGTLGTASTSNMPGARNSAVSWTDSSGNFWLFGGNGEAQSGSGGYLNDLWMFNQTAGWTWVSGSSSFDSSGSYGTQGTAAAGNVPGGRQSASAWIDSSNNLWVFGGQGYDSAGHVGYMNDLWVYSPTAGWTWISGSNTIAALAVYGTKGVAAAGNVPGARGSSNAWIDSSGDLWLFGGFTYQGSMDDLWMYNPTSGNWMWVSGSSTADVKGVYGTKGIAAATNVPGARNSAAAWTDPSGAFWLFGGAGFDSAGTSGDLNDLWKYVP
jgi:N-acetylneuraminic acid mutarotase